LHSALARRPHREIQLNGRALELAGAQEREDEETGGRGAGAGRGRCSPGESGVLTLIGRLDLPAGRETYRRRSIPGKRAVGCTRATAGTVVPRVARLDLRIGPRPVLELDPRIAPRPGPGPDLRIGRRPGPGPDLRIGRRPGPGPGLDLRIGRRPGLGLDPWISQRPRAEAEGLDGAGGR
jgi:hypothetical protein